MTAIRQIKYPVNDIKMLKQHKINAIVQENDYFIFDKTKFMQE
jgi:hypothetical protein